MLTVEQNKKASSPFDDKRFVCVYKVNTLPLGHCGIEKVKLMHELPKILVCYDLRSTVLYT